ncbi:hypothetical protein H7B90_00705 [Cohnella xylanilytica]|uniref:Uncharacterized protein n=1 Tax=Cohnella xylanilytica TaxID=557555 RepID=A0A841TV95_9BACL|nr:hypothetical protein [Cohnella xylanilytica]MBB6689911.1 hypothetical protein [Cohnella xylanilytica]
MDRQEVADWIAANMLDTYAWDRASEHKQTVAIVQAERNLARWYPSTDLVVSLVAYQAVWELQGVDPALKYLKHNVKSIGDNGESISYKDGERDSVAPDVRELLGATAEEVAKQKAVEAAQQQYGGALV